jgi:hypothetical protein
LRSPFLARFPEQAGPTCHGCAASQRGASIDLSFPDDPQESLIRPAFVAEVFGGPEPNPVYARLYAAYQRAEERQCM